MTAAELQSLMQPVRDFLGGPTPEAWVTHAITQPQILIQDHANCEKKAASTAMNLMFRYSFLRTYKLNWHN